MSPLEGSSVNPSAVSLTYHIHRFPFFPMQPHPPGCLSQTVRNFTLISKDSLPRCLLSLKVHILRTIFNRYICSSSFLHLLLPNISMQREDPSGPLSPKANSAEGQQDLPMLASRMPSLGVRSYDREGFQKDQSPRLLAEKEQQSVESFLQALLCTLVTSEWLL